MKIIQVSEKDREIADYAEKNYPREQGISWDLENLSSHAFPGSSKESTPKVIAVLRYMVGFPDSLIYIKPYCELFHMHPDDFLRIIKSYQRERASRISGLGKSDSDTWSKMQRSLGQEIRGYWETH